MGLVQEFKSFIMKGNIVDLAVAVIMGAAFSKVVSSFVADIVMPPIGVALGGKDFKSLAYVLQEAVGEAPAVTMNYGNFIQTIIDLLIVGFVIFMVVKGYNATQKKAEEAAPAGPSNEEVLLGEIRDLLKK